MSTVERFQVTLAASAAELPGLELVPERLARAAAAVLPVDGAGISLFFTPYRRLPLGASDVQSAEAERLQLTAGEGPCLSAHASGRPIVADEATIASRWPAFYANLVSRTFIRGIISLPLGNELRGFGALDLYMVSPNGVGSVRLADALTVADQVGAVFHNSSLQMSPHGDGPAWLDAPAAQRRSLVWQAMGFVNAGLRVTSTDALALLQAHAYSENMTLDELAALILDRQVPLELLTLGTHPPR